MPVVDSVLQVGYATKGISMIYVIGKQYDINHSVMLITFRLKIIAKTYINPSSNRVTRDMFIKMFPNYASSWFHPPGSPRALL